MELKVYEMPEVKPFKFESSRDVYFHFQKLVKADREMVVLLFLNSKNQLMDVELHSIGTVDSSSIYVREVMKSCLLKRATSLITVHNHPSGDPRESASDCEITKQLVFACEIMQVKFLDHIIIGNKGFVSFADEGLIGEYELAVRNKIGGGYEERMVRG